MKLKVDDCTPLMYACAAGSTEIVEMLLACPTIRVDQRTAVSNSTSEERLFPKYQFFCLFIASDVRIGWKNSKRFHTRALLRA